MSYIYIHVVQHRLHERCSLDNRGGGGIGNVHTSMWRMLVAVT